MTQPPSRIKIGDDIELRLLSEKDAPALFQLIEKNRVYLRAWLPWVDFTQTLEDEFNYLRSIHAQQHENKNFACSIWYRGQIAGTISYHPIDWVIRKVEIGYWLGAEFQGRGLMTRSCQTFVSYAFNELKLNKVEIRCATANFSSCAIPRRLGFIQEGIIRQAEWLYDHYVDLILYGMLASEWQERAENSK